jgi:hypothetical protein
MKSGFYVRLLLAGFLLMNGTPAGAQDLGEFAMRTAKGFYFTAINGGGRTTDPVVVTSAPSATTWEKFRLAVMDPASFYDKSIRTSGGNFVTAVDGGGRTTDVLHTDATQVRAWEQFRLHDLGPSSMPTYFAIQTIHGFLLTAVGEGGKFQDAVHTDATQVRSWEHVRLVKCGDLGSDHLYYIISANGNIFGAANGGGQVQGAISLRPLEAPLAGDVPEQSFARFKLIRQSDGSYALQTSNGVNYVTALGGGGQVQKITDPDCHWWEVFTHGGCAAIAGITDIFHTDATQVRGWERFRFIDQGDCKYAIQTVSGFFVGVFRGLLTTDRSEVSSENEKWQLVMHGLASPAIIR